MTSTINKETEIVSSKDAVLWAQLTLITVILQGCTVMILVCCDYWWM